MFIVLIFPPALRQVQINVEKSVHTRVDEGWEPLRRSQQIEIETDDHSSDVGNAKFADLPIVKPFGNSGYTV